MKKVESGVLKAGMQFSEDAFLDEQNIFIPAYTLIKDKELKSLRQWGITHILTKGNLLPVGHPGKARVLPSFSKAPSHPPLQGARLPSFQGDRPSFFAFEPAGLGIPELRGRVFRNVAELSAIYQRVQRKDFLEAKCLDEMTAEVLSLGREEQGPLCLTIFSALPPIPDYGYEGFIGAWVAGQLGAAAKLPIHHLGYLVTGMLLHDFGMAFMPSDLLGRKGKLSPEEQIKITAHPIHSYKLATVNFKYSNEVGQVALQHHERWDGSGYPRRLAGADIDLLARLASLADAFTAMISRKTRRPPFSPYAAIRALLQDKASRFDPKLLQVFAQVFGIFPPGTYVKLSNGSQACVLEAGAQPLRPKLRLLADTAGQALKSSETIDLAHHASLNIISALSPDEFINQKVMQA